MNKPPASPMTTSSTPGDDVAALKDLLSWATERKVLLSSATVGSVRVDIAIPVAPSSFAMPTGEDKESLYRQFGGKAYADLVGETDDDVPAVTA